MKIIIPGGTGHLGTILGSAFQRDGHEVVVFSRMPQNAPWRVVAWNARSPGAWMSELEKADVVINLAGRNVNCRYTPVNRRAIMESRVDSAKVIGLAIAAAKRPPRVWLQMSTATIYAHRFDAANDETSGILGGTEPDAPDTWKFSIDVATSWEQALRKAGPLPSTRKVLMRSAVVMSPESGGPFDILLRLVRYCLGGQSGDGRQFVSWIHDQDFIRAVRFLIENDGLEGAINLAAPHPLPNAEFMRALRAVWGIPFGLPATEWMLELGALFLRTETELILKSRRVMPGLLLRHGFEFLHPDWPAAAADLCRRRAGNRVR